MARPIPHAPNSLSRINIKTTPLRSREASDSAYTANSTLTGHTGCSLMCRVLVTGGAFENAPMRKTLAVSLTLATLACAGGVTAPAADLVDFAVDSPAIVNGAKDIRAGKLVQSPEGNVIGTIQSVVSGPGRGAFRYALVTTDSGIVAIPCWAISHLLRDGHIVIEPGLLAAAPRMQRKKAQHTEKSWKTQANDYWRGWQ